MSQRHEVKSRKCHVCAFYFPTTAAQIKEHAAKCGQKEKAEKEGRVIRLPTKPYQVVVAS